MTFNKDATFTNRTLSLLNTLTIRLEREIPRDPSFWGGKAGIALYFAALAQATREHSAHQNASKQHPHTIAQQLTTSALNEIARFSPSDIIKHAWVLWSATAIDLIEADDASLESSENTAFCHDIEELLLDTLQQAEAWHAEYDIISGLLAVGAHAAHALAHSTSPHSAPHCAQLLAQVLKLLCAMAEQDEQHQWWPSTRQNGLPSRLARFPNGYRDLGLAHGNAGIIAFMARLIQQGLHTETATNVLRKVVPWLLAQRNSGEQLARFPYLAETPNSESRCGWCYGDVGISWALMQAGAALNEASWLQLAHQIALSVARRPLDTMGFTDHALCHGTLGVSHILHRQALFFADAELEGCSLSLLDQGLTAFEAQLATSGSANPSYLEGWAGMGLALLSAISLENADNNPPLESSTKLRWDYPLLLA